MSSTSVSVIGAGPAGLATAYFLIKKGAQPVIYEAGSDIGGLAGSVTLWGRSLDIGPHIFLESSQPPAVEFWKEIGGKDLQRLTLSRGMILNNQLINYPPKPLELLRALGIWRLSLAVTGIVKARLLPSGSIKTAGDFFRNYYGNYFRRLVFKPFCEKYMGIADTEVDTGFATGLVSLVKKTKKTDVQPEPKKLKTLLYHKQGTKKMWSLIADRICENTEIIFNKKLSKVVTEGKIIKRLQFNDGSVIDTTGTVVSTLPLSAFLNVIDACPAAILEEAKKLKSYNTILIYLRASPLHFPFNYTTVFDHSLEAGRITNFNTWQTENNKEDTIICIEYWCNSRSLNWNATDEALIQKASRELGNIGHLGDVKVMDAKVFRLPNSHPVLNSGYAESLSKINNYLSQFENLVLAGRHATFKWDGQADNIIAGMKIADALVQNTF